MSDDLVALLLRGHETPGLDYKAPMKWDESDKKACCELVKDIMAMANSGGGWIVIGVRETGTGFVLEGLTDEQATSFETTRLARTTKKYSDPPIAATVHKVQHESRSYALIGVPGFEGMPHMCVRQHEEVLRARWFYVRTEASESAPLDTSHRLSALVERAIRNRRDEMLRAITAVLKGERETPEQEVAERFGGQIAEAEEAFLTGEPAPEPGGAYCTVTAYPERFEEDRFKWEELNAALHTASEDLIGWPFFYIDPAGKDSYTIGDGFESNIEYNYGLGPAHHFYQVRRSGLIYHRELRGEESLPQFDGQRVMDYGLALARLTLAVRAAARFYAELLEPSEAVMLTTNFDDTKQRSLTSLKTARFILPGHTARVDTVPATITRSVADLAANTAAVAAGMAKDVFWLFNWTDVDEKLLRERVQEVLDRRFR